MFFIFIFVGLIDISFGRLILSHFSDDFFPDLFFHDNNFLSFGLFFGTFLELIESGRFRNPAFESN